MKLHFLPDSFCNAKLQVLNITFFISLNAFLYIDFTSHIEISILNAIIFLRLLFCS